MENNIKITIITVSYNSVKTIEKTIWSIINQTYKNIEYIVIDGESNDGTLDIIKKYQERISCWISEKDYGIYDAMNKGIDLATGDYVYFIGSDDWLVNFNIIEKVVSYLEINQSIDILSGQVWNVYEKFGLQKIFHNKFDKNMIENGYCIPHQGTFVKTAHIKNRKFDVQYKIAADYKMFLDLYFTGNLKFQFVEEKIAFFSIGGVSALQYEKSASEHSEIMHQYNLPKENIIIYKKMHKYNYLYKIKKVVKYLMEKIGMLGLSLKLFGWKNHKCENYFCHYCNR